MRRTFYLVTVIVTISLSACAGLRSSRVLGPPESSHHPVGVTYYLSKPVFRVEEKKLSTGKPATARYDLIIDYTADPDQRYEIGFKSGLIGNTEFALNLTDDGRVTTLNSSFTDTSPQYIKALGELAVSAVGAAGGISRELAPVAVERRESARAVDEREEAADEAAQERKEKEKKLESLQEADITESDRNILIQAIESLEQEVTSLAQELASLGPELNKLVNRELELERLLQIALIVDDNKLPGTNIILNRIKTRVYAGPPDPVLKVGLAQLIWMLSQNRSSQFVTAVAEFETEYTDAANSHGTITTDEADALNTLLDKLINRATVAEGALAKMMTMARDLKKMDTTEFNDEADKAADVYFAGGTSIVKKAYENKNSEEVAKLLNKEISIANGESRAGWAKKRMTALAEESRVKLRNAFNGASDHGSAIQRVLPYAQTEHTYSQAILAINRLLAHTTLLKVFVSLKKKINTALAQILNGRGSEETLRKAVENYRKAVATVLEADVKINDRKLSDRRSALQEFLKLPLPASFWNDSKAYAGYRAELDKIDATISAIINAPPPKPPLPLATSLTRIYDQLAEIPLKLDDLKKAAVAISLKPEEVAFLYARAYWLFGITDIEKKELGVDGVVVYFLAGNAP